MLTPIGQSRSAGIGGIQTTFRSSDSTPVNNSTALVTSSVLVINLEANASYEFWGSIVYDATSTADIKFTFSSPAGSTGFFVPDGLAGSAGSNLSSVYRARVALGTPFSVGAIGAGVATALEVRPTGFIATSSTAGTLAFQYAQNTADATDLVIRTGSRLMARRLA